MTALVRSARQGAMGLVLLLAWLPAPAAESRAPVAEAVEEAVRTWLASHPHHRPSGTTARIGPVDPRLRLPACDAPLEPYTLRPLRPVGRNTIGVRCPGSQPWKLYVPVSFQRVATVVAVRRALPPGHTLTRDDLETVRREADATGTWLSRPEAAIGQTLTRPVMAGQALQPDWLDQPTVVERGQQVLLVSRGTGIHVRMEGIALASAGIGQRIKVRNVRSKQVVEGTVAEDGRILVGH